MRYNKTFYEKHGLKITEEPIITHEDEAWTKAAERFYALVSKNTNVSLATIAELESYVVRYPDAKSLKNHLYVGYIRTNQKQKAADLLTATLKQHPDYIFAHLNVANRLAEDNNFNKAASILKEPFDVRHFEKEEFIHISAFKGYYRTAFRVALGQKKFDEAERINKMLFDYDPKDEDLKESTLLLITTRMGGRIAEKQKNKEVAIISKPIRGQYLSDKDGKPVFNHAEIHDLYRFSLDNIPKTVIQTLLKLPRQRLIQDLEHVLMDTLLRNDYFQQDEWEDDTNLFFIHALYLLTDLRAYQSLPVILDFLRQDNDFREYWVSDWLESYFDPTLYLLGSHQLGVLKDFALEENLSPWHKALACEAVAQVAMKEPERRGEALQWFNDVIQYHLDNPKNLNLIDSTFLSSLLCDLIHFRAVELEDKARELYATGWIDNGFCGDLAIFLEDLHKPHNPYYNKPMPVDLDELYSKEYEARVDKSQMQPDPELLALLDDPYHKYSLDLMTEAMVKADKKNNSYDDDDWEPQLPVKRTEAKVGRNDPCPCGSGKKYKKCHGA